MNWETKGEVPIYPDGGDGLYWFVARRSTVVRLRCWCPGRRVLIANGWCVGPWTVLDRWERYRCFVSKFVKKALAKANRTSQGAKCIDVKFQEDYPALTEFMTLEFDEGKPRQTATVNLFYRMGSFQAFLNDRESEQSLCVTSETVLGIWMTLERALTSDDPGWRPLGGANGQGKKRK